MRNAGRGRNCKPNPPAPKNSIRDPHRKITPSAWRASCFQVPRALRIPRHPASATSCGAAWKGAGGAAVSAVRRRGEGCCQQQWRQRKPGARLFSKNHGSAKALREREKMNPAPGLHLLQTILQHRPLLRGQGRNFQQSRNLARFFHVAGGGGRAGRHQLVPGLEAAPRHDEPGAEGIRPHDVETGLGPAEVPHTGTAQQHKIRGRLGRRLRVFFLNGVPRYGRWRRRRVCTPRASAPSPNSAKAGGSGIASTRKMPRSVP